MVSTNTNRITKSNKQKQDILSGGGESAVSGPTRAIGGESSPTPDRVSSFITDGAGSRSPQEPCGGQGWDCPTSLLDTCDQVHKNSLPGGDREGVEYILAIAEGHEYHKKALVLALRACHRVIEAERVKQCGEDFKVGKCLDCGASPAFPITCDHRLCPDCAARRGAILVSEHEDILKQLRYPKMLTLTFVSVVNLDKDYIRWARNCFTRLRRRKIMAGCWGGIYSFEATHSKQGWHLHIHALIGSGYIEQGELSGEWQKISGAKVVDIRAIQGQDKWGAVKEVVKYPAKAASFLDSSRLVNEFLLATERVNLAYGFGVMYRVKTRRHAEVKIKCPVCGGGNITFRDGFGFCVPKMAIERVKGGYLWHPPPLGGYCD